MAHQQSQDQEPADLEDAEPVQSTGGAGQLHTPSEHGESVASGTASSTADVEENGENLDPAGGEDAAPRPGLGEMYAHSRHPQSVASGNGAASSGADREVDVELAESEEPATRPGSGQLQVQNRYGESVASSSRNPQSSANSREGSPHLTESSDDDPELPTEATTTDVPTIIITMAEHDEFDPSLHHALDSFPSSSASASASGGQPDEASIAQCSQATPSIPPTRRTGRRETRLVPERVDTIPSQASALGSKLGYDLRTISRTGLLTVYSVPYPGDTPIRSIQLREGNHPLIRFTSSPTGTVITNEHISLHDDEDGRVKWSEPIRHRILDICTCWYTDTLYVLTETEVRVYDLRHDTYSLRARVPQPCSESGKIAQNRDSLYICRENEGLVKRMETQTHKITPILTGLGRPTVITVDEYFPRSNPSSIFAVADHQDVNIYSTRTNNLITTIAVGSTIIDIQIINRFLFVLMRNQIGSYRLSLLD